MFDSAKASRAPREVQIQGRTLLVAPLALDDWGRLTAWLLDHHDDPVTACLRSIDRARRAGVEVGEDDRRQLLAAAREDARHWPPFVASDAWLAAVMRPPGGAHEFLAAVLRKHQPDLTADEIDWLGANMTDAEANRVVSLARGFDPAPKPDAPAA